MDSDPTPSLCRFARQAVAVVFVGFCAPAQLPATVQTVPASAGVPFSAGSLSNPLFPAPSADPWVTQHNGIWYALLSAGRSLQLRAAPSLSGLAAVEPVTIWKAPDTGLVSANIWAPQMHFLDGRWYIYLAGDDGDNNHHRMWVLEAQNPLGPWLNRGQLETDGWAIDGTLLEQNGRRYFVWSGWPVSRNLQQNLYISEMRNPWTLDGRRILLTQPDQPWERQGFPVCEGPEVLRHGGRTFIVYSASGSWTDDYCLGLLANDDGDFLNPRSWIKRGPVFKKTERVWGVGHCCFAQDPAATPDHPIDLIFYHAKTKHTPGWDDRNIRVQPFRWSPDGLPEFGDPVDLVRPANS